METEQRNVSGELLRNWWGVLLRGFAAIIFGIITFVAPGLSLVTMIFVFGAFAFADGVLALVTAMWRRGDQRPTWALVLEGLVGVGIGLVTLFRPGVTTLGLLWVIAWWAFVTGVLELVAAVRLRKTLKGDWLLALTGVASIALGVLLMLRPVAGLFTLVLWTGAYALVSGIIMVALALQLRALARPRAPSALGGGVVPGGRGPSPAASR